MYAAGLKKDGTVVTTSNVVDVSGWKNIIAIAGGTSHIVDSGKGAINILLKRPTQR